MRYIILLSAVMFMVAVANAEIYKWSDRDGGVHYTDNLDKIPPSFRNKAKEVDVMPMIQATEKPTESIAPTGQDSNLFYGGHDETWWRTSFKSLRDEISDNQDNLTEEKEKLVALRRSRNLFMKREDRVDFNDLEGDVKRDEEQMMNLKNRLADLDNEAAKYGVPMEWRQ